MQKLEEWLSYDGRQITFTHAFNGVQCVMKDEKEEVTGIGSSLVPALLDAIKRKFNVTISF